MPFSMRLVAEDTDTVLIEPQELESEQELHNFITRHTGLQLGAVDTFLIGSEHTTRTGVRADVLGLAATGHPVIIELKQAGSGRKGSRTALTQALEYAADVRDGDYTTYRNIYQAYSDTGTSLQEAHAAYFDLDEPVEKAQFAMAQEPRLVLVAEQFKASDVDAARYLRDANNVDLTCIEVSPVRVNGDLVYGFEQRLASKRSPSLPGRHADDESIPWLTRKMEESYYQRFHERFDISTPAAATARDSFHKGHRFVSAPSHPDGLYYSVKLDIFSSPPEISFGVSPRGNQAIERAINANRDQISLTFKNRKYRRIRGSADVSQVLEEAQLETISPEISESIGRVLWQSEPFQRSWNEFLNMVERWDDIIDSELDDPTV